MEWDRVFFLVPHSQFCWLLKQTLNEDVFQTWKTGSWLRVDTWEKKHHFFWKLGAHPFPPTWPPPRNKALLNPYFSGGYVRGGVGWPSIRTSEKHLHSDLPLTCRVKAAGTLTLCGSPEGKTFAHHGNWEKFRKHGNCHTTVAKLNLYFQNKNHSDS